MFTKSSPIFPLKIVLALVGLTQSDKLLLLSAVYVQTADTNPHLSGRS